MSQALKCNDLFFSLLFDELNCFVKRALSYI